MLATEAQKNVRVIVNIRPEIHDKLVEIAKIENRSVPNLITTLIEDEIVFLMSDPSRFN